MSRTHGLLALFILTLPACRSRAGSGDGLNAPAGRLSASWTGSDTGKLSAPVRASWCADQRRLELTAVQGDAGVGLALYPVSEAGPGSYPAFLPGADSVPRPGVSGAGRWFTERRIFAYQSDSGSLELERAGAELAGHFELRMRTPDRQDSVQLNGRFSGVRPSACRPAPDDSVSVAPEKQ